MPGKKEQFRFRIPWISGSSTRTKQTSKSPSQLHTKYTPIQRPPFRPPGIDSLPPQHPFHTTASASGVQKETRETTVETERKKMLTIATSNPSGKDIKVTADPMTTRNNVPTISKDDVPGFVNKVATVIPKEPPIDEKTVSVVTLAGENRGATMNVADSHSQSTRKKGSINVHRRTNQEKEKDETGKAYVNSNIQSLNNSFMLQGSINGRDPGVRVIFPQQPQAENKQGLENSRAEVNNNISRVERLTHRPVVRRRCLRGLFHEPSDSDPDNPNKPPRHGCKFSCGDARKDKDPDIF